MYREYHPVSLWMDQQHLVRRNTMLQGSHTSRAQSRVRGTGFRIWGFGARGLGFASG